MSKTTNWKNNELAWPKKLAKYGVQAKRISRAGNYSESVHDTDIPSFPELKSDCKFSNQPWRQNNMLEIVRDKYCPNREDIPLLFCRQYKDRKGKVVIDDEFAAMLIAYWMGVAPKEELWEIYKGERKPLNKEDA